jgi:predicted nucleic acid-binding protein
MLTWIAGFMKNRRSHSLETMAGHLTFVAAPIPVTAESEATHQEWRGIVAAAKVSGIQVHDARLVAAMHAHGIENLLTLNAKDLRRFSSISVLSPEDGLASLI